MQVKEEILKILPKSPNQTKIAHIITAANLDPNPWWVKKDENLLKEAGFQVTAVDVEGKNESDLRKLLQGFDVMYVQGGNTFYLLKYVRESGFDKVVKELIDGGVIYVGVSAGSQIVGPSVEIAGWHSHLLGGPDPNTVNLTDLTALNFVPFQIFVHYVPEDYEGIKTKSKASKYQVRILTNDQAFLVQDGKVTLVGKGEEVKIS